MLLAEKIYGRIKGRECADGRGKRGKPKKEDAASPTFSTESIFTTSAIDAHDRCDVETIDIPGALLRADSDKHIILVLKGNLALLMCHVDQKLYRKYIIFDMRGKPVLYVKMLKSLYGLL